MNFDLDTTEGMNNAVTWTRNHFELLSDNGAWGIPRSGTLVRINKTEKIATIITGFAPDPAIKRVIEAMGWTVIEK
jgi:hypothetical protein